MNRNYRVVFNQSTGTYVAVAENTTARKKSKTTVKTIATALAVSALMMGVSTVAEASWQSPDNTNTHYGNNHIAIGQGAQVGAKNANPAAADAIAIGSNAKALGNNAIALGFNALVGEGTIQSIAIGSSAKATGTQSTAIGNDTYATGHSSVAIGGDDVNQVIDEAGNEYKQLTGVTLIKSQWQNTESKGHGSVAIGVQSLAEGNFSTALGMTAKTQGTGSVAFGANARGLGKGATGIGTASQAIGQQATAIGMNSAATAQNATAIGSGGNTPATATKATADGAIAIGGNLVKGSQATGKNAIAIGGESEASKDNAIAIGAGSKSTHGNSVALGVNSVATGANIDNAAWQPKDATGKPISVVGNAIGEVSIGKTGSERRLTNVAAGSADTDGVNVSQLKALDSALTSNVNVLTNNLAKVDGKVNNLQTSVYTLEQGWMIQSDGDAVSAVKARDTVQINSGKNIDVARTGNAITVNTAQDMTLNSVSFSDTAGNNSVLSASGLKVSNAAGSSSAHYGSEQLVFNQGTANAVSIGNTGINAGNQKITNVADGALNSTSKDAVNGSQLHKTNQDLNQVSNQVTQNTDDIANLSQGWKLQSDNDTASAVKAGDTVQFNSGKNIDVSRDGNTLTIATANDLNLNSVNLQDASGQTLNTLDASGLNVSNADNSLTTNVGAGIINVGGNTHTIVVDGNTGEITGLSNTSYDPNNIQADRAATEGQIADLGQQLTNKGFNISAQGGAGDTVKLGETVDFSNTDGNIEISNDTDNGIQFKLANAIAVQSVIAGDTASGNFSVMGSGGTTVSDALGNNATYGANGISIGNTTGTVISIKDGDVNFGGNTLGGVGAGVNPDDAINKGQLDNLGDHLAGDIFGGNAAYDGNTITWSNIGGTGANTIDGAINTVNNKVNLGWNAADTAGNSFNVAAGQTVGFINSDGNIDITAVGSSLTFDLAKDIKVNSVTADDGLGNKTVLGTTGTTVTDAAGNSAHYGANSSSFTDTAGNSNISSATGTTLTDAAGNTYITTAAGSVLTNAAGDQTNLSAAGTHVQDALGNNATYGANGISIGNTTGTVISIKDGDVNFGGNTLGGVGAGVNPDDAINKGQLDNLADHLAGDIFGGNAAYDGNTITWSNIGGTGANTIDGAINTVNNKVNLGWNAADTAGNSFNVAAGQTVGFINSDGNLDITAAGSSLTFDLAKDINVNSVTADDGLGNKTVLGTTGTTVTDAAGNSAHYGANSSSFTDTAGNSNISSATGTTLTDAAGNTYITTAAGSELTNAAGDQTNLSAAGTHVQDALGNNATYGANGISIGNTTGTVISIKDGDVNFGGNTLGGVGAGVNPDDAINKGQLDNLGDHLAGDIFGGNAAYDGNTITWSNIGGTGANTIDGAINTVNNKVNLGWNAADTAGNSFNVAAGQTVGFINSDGNLDITAAGSSLTFDLANDINVNSVTAEDGLGNKTVLGTTGTSVSDAAGNSAHYGANSSSFTDLAGNSSVSSATGTTLTDAAGNTYITTAAGSELINANGDITNLTAAGTEVTDALGNNATYGANGISIADAAGNLSTNVGAGIINVGGSTHTIAIDGNTGEITGLSNTKYDPNNIQADRAATEGQVADLDNKINNAGFNISAQGGAGDTVTLGETVDFSSSDSNLAVKAGADNQILFTLSSDLTLNSVSMQDAAGNVNYVDATGSRVADALGNNAFYGAIGSQFTDKAGNSFNSSATGSIVTNAAGDSTNVSAGNISVSTGNGGTVSIGGNGIDAGGNNITNVADGKAAGDAVNKGQLDTAVDNINNSIGAAINGGVQYDKNADGTVNKGSITLEGGANGTTITNVANGKVEAGSKDAVNGGQLHDALQQINNNQSTINNDVLGVTVGPDGKPKLDLDIYDVANQTKTGNLTLVDAINTVNQEGTKYAHTNAADESEEPGLINPNNNAASAGGKNSSAFGVNAIVDDTATNGLAMGYQSQVGEGATNAVSIGSQTQANGESSLALGHGSQVNGKQSISIGTGNKVNGNHSGAIGDPSVINGDNSYVLGNNNHIDADNSFVVGNEVTIGKDAADMSKANGASFGGSVGIGNGSTVAAAVGTQNVTIGNTTYEFAGSAPVGTVSVGSKDEERTLTNVAAGRIDATSTDAINGSQLHATNQAVGDLYQMNNKLNNRIDGLEDESRAGVATALAVANLPQVYIPGKSGLAIATGVHKGEVGYALGYSSISEGGNWVFKASATANRMGDVGGGAGLLYMFD